MATEDEKGEDWRDCAPGTDLPPERTWVPLDDRPNLKADGRKAARILWDLVCACIRGDRKS